MDVSNKWVVGAGSWSRVNFVQDFALSQGQQNLEFDWPLLRSTVHKIPWSILYDTVPQSEIVSALHDMCNKSKSLN